MRQGRQVRVASRLRASTEASRRQPDRNRLVCGPDSSDGAKYFQRKTHAIFVTAAIVVSTSIGKGRKEAGEQIAVCTMQLQPIRACCGGKLGRVYKISLDPVHVG